MNQLVRRYVEISKVETQEDGTLKVYGIASSGAVDSDGERISPDAMRAALPDYMKFGAVREMHQASAAGTALEAEVDKEGKTLFAAHVVDPVAIKKVETKTYKGFSIGGKVLARDPEDKKLITGIRLIEVSLVDRPANPEAVITMYKAEGDEAPQPGDPPAPVQEPPKEPTAKENAEKIAKEDREAIDQLGIILNKRTLSAQEMLKASLQAIAKAVEPPPKPRAKIVPAKFKKGMGGLSMFADLLQRIGWLAQDAEFEAEWEGDNSPLPAQLRDWLASGITIFEAMTAEETAELLATLKKPVEVLESAARAADVAKGGAKFSQATKDALAEAHDTMTKCFGHAEKCFKAAKDACDKMDSLGYKEPETKDDAAQPGDMLKIVMTSPPAPPEPPEPPEPPATEVIVKLTADTTALRTDLAKSLGVIEELQKRLKAIEDQPAPAKGVLKVVPVDKADDSQTTASNAGDVKPILKPDGSVDLPATLAKTIHRFGGVPVNIGAPQS